VRWCTYVGEDRVARRGLERGPAAPRAGAGRPAGPLGDDGTRLRQAAERARQESAVDPAAVRLLPPVPRPPSVRDFMALEEDVVTASAAIGGTVDPLWYRQPVSYFSSPASLLGAHDPVAVSPGSRAFNYELEVAVVIGREGADLSPEEAMDHIAGYVLFCDWSARGVHGEEMKFNLGPPKGQGPGVELRAVDAHRRRAGTGRRDGRLGQRRAL